MAMHRVVRHHITTVSPKSLLIADQAQIAIGLLRPGYTDENGRTSDGVRGLTVGDNYDDGRVSPIARAVERMKATIQRHSLISLVDIATPFVP